MLGTLRRIIAGIILGLLGLALLSTGSHGPEGMRTLVALGLAAAWAGCGVALVANVPWARAAGLAVSLLGLGVGFVLAVSGIDSPRVLLDLLFSPADTARWYVVMPTGWLFAILSAVSGALLLAPFRRPQEPA